MISHSLLFVPVFFQVFILLLNNDSITEQYYQIRLRLYHFHINNFCSAYITIIINKYFCSISFIFSFPYYLLTFYFCITPVLYYGNWIILEQNNTFCNFELNNTVNKTKWTILCYLLQNWNKSKKSLWNLDILK